MQHLTRAALSSLLGFCTSLQLGCITDTVPPDIYGGSGSQEPPGTSRDPVMETPEQPTAPELRDGGSEPPRDTPLGSDPPPLGCDLTGSWLITERLVASGLGVRQASLVWRYYEIAQSGDQLRVEKGLVCGGQIQQVDAVSAAVDYRAAWPKQLEANPQAGRQGSASVSASGCKVAFARMAIVLGATMPHYGDENTTLPALEQQAAGSSPGWEDWDGDGKPGVSLNVSGLATGVRYCAARTWSAWQGEITSGADHFKLSADWSSEESVLGVTSDILRATGARDGDPALHFAEFARLSAGQVSGDDAAICAQIRELAPTLTPDANQ